MSTQNEMFLYLDDLRDSGVTNMFGARPYLMRAFDIPPARATATLSAWMKTYSQRHPKETRS
jgi:hypothetical protein